MKIILTLTCIIAFSSFMIKVETITNNCMSLPLLHCATCSTDDSSFCATC